MTIGDLVVLTEATMALAGADAYSHSVSYPFAEGGAGSWSGNAIQVYGSGTGYADITFELDYEYILSTGEIPGNDLAGTDIIVSVWDYTANNEVASAVLVNDRTRWMPLVGRTESSRINKTLYDVPLQGGHQYALRMEVNTCGYKGPDFTSSGGCSDAMNNHFNGTSGPQGIDYRYITIVW